MNGIIFVFLCVVGLTFGGAGIVWYFFGALAGFAAFAGLWVILALVWKWFEAHPPS